MLRFEVKAGPTGSLFGSVTPTDIADEIWRTRKIRVDRRKIDVDNIKRIGRYDVPIDVFQDVRVEVKTLVVPEGGELPSDEELEAMAAAELAEQQAAAPPAPAAVEFEYVEVEEPSGDVETAAEAASRRTRTCRYAPVAGLFVHRPLPGLWNCRGTSRRERPFCPQGRRPTPLQAWTFPLQMAQKRHVHNRPFDTW